MRSRQSVLVIMLILLADCGGGDEGTKPQIDTIAPATITDLAVLSRSASSVTLIWTAPGNDGMKGRATQYDIRFSSAVLTEESWLAAIPVSSPPTPKVAGSGESFAVGPLQQGSIYYFGVKAADEVPNWSELSNVVGANTDVTPPGRVTDLAISAVWADSITLSWTAPGDDGAVGTAAQYDIRYATSPITEEAWAMALQAGGEPPPHAAGTREFFTVGSLQQDTLYYFGVKTADEVPNWSILSNVDRVNPPGRNSQGSLLVHTDDAIIFSSGTDYCVSTIPSTCEGLVTRSDNYGPQASMIWFLWAFPPDATPEVTGVRLGVRTSLPAGHIRARGACGVGSLEVPTEDWPSDGSGSAIGWGTPDNTKVKAFYWFALYGAAPGDYFGTTVDPRVGFAAFADGADPPQEDRAFRFGTVKWGEPGSNICPPFQPPR